MNTHQWWHIALLAPYHQSNLAVSLAGIWVHERNCTDSEKKEFRWFIRLRTHYGVENVCLWRKWKFVRFRFSQQSQVPMDWPMNIRTCNILYYLLGAPRQKKLNWKFWQLDVCISSVLYLHWRVPYRIGQSLMHISQDMMDTEILNRDHSVISMWYHDDTQVCVIYNIDDDACCMQHVPYNT